LAYVVIFFGGVCNSKFVFINMNKNVNHNSFIWYITFIQYISWFLFHSFWSILINFKMESIALGCVEKLCYWHGWELLVILSQMHFENNLMLNIDIYTIMISTECLQAYTIISHSSPKSEILLSTKWRMCNCENEKERWS
jgi:hypothetical protein